MWDLDEDDATFGDELPGTCGWCGRPIEEGEWVVTITLVRPPGMPLPPGPFELPVGERVIAATVPARESPAGRHGASALILLCSEDCATTVRSALRQQRQAFNS